MSTRNKVSISILAMITVVIGGAKLVHAQDDADENLDRQLGIMAKILDERLESIGSHSVASLNIFPFSDLLGGRGLGLFGAQNPKVQYVPTVGAIFTIPVRIALTELPESEKGEAKSAPSHADLWDRFSDEPERKSLTEKLIEFAEELEEGMEIGEDGEVNIDVGSIKARVMKHLNADADGNFDLNISLGGEALEYDADALDELRVAVIETIAEYGHRMTQLPNDERIIVVLEAPKPVAESRHYRTFNVGNWEKAFSGDHPRGRQFGSRSHGSFGTHEDFEELLSGMKLRLSGIEGLGRHGFGADSSRDRWLFSFNRSDLKGERSYEQLQGKVVERRY